MLSTLTAPGKPARPATAPAATSNRGRLPVAANGSSVSRISTNARPGWRAATAEEAALGQYRLGAIRLVARGQALKTGESSFQEIALMLEFLEVRFNLIGVQPAQPFLRPQPAQALLGR